MTHADLPLQGSLCFSCIHRQSWGKCDAFPNGIPNELLFGGVPHLEVWGGEATDERGAILYTLDPAEEEGLILYQEVSSAIQAE